MKRIVLLLVAVVALSGCSMMVPGGGDPPQANAYDADIAQSESKAIIACFGAEEAADREAMGKLSDAKDVLLGLAIKGLSTAANGGKSKCGTRANFYDAQIVLIKAGVDKYAKSMDTVGNIANSAVTLGLGWKVADTVGEMFQKAGTNTFGDYAQVDGSFNAPKATSIGEGTIATVQPYDVRPEVVQPAVVEQQVLAPAQVVQPVVVPVVQP